METVADRLSRLHQQCGLLQRRTELDARLHALRQSEAALSQQLAQPALIPVDQTGSTTIPCDAQQAETESRIMELQGHREDLACELAALSYQWLENRTEQVGLEKKVTLPWSDSAVQHAINRLRGFDEQSALWLNGSHSIESSLIQSLRIPAIPRRNERMHRPGEGAVQVLDHARKKARSIATPALPDFGVQGLNDRIRSDHRRDPGQAVQAGDSSQSQ